MHIPKRYFHDRAVLLLLTTNVFLALLGAILIMMRLDTSRTGYIIQDRTHLGSSVFQSGSPRAFYNFVAFALIVAVLHTLLSMRVYHVRRHFSVAILGMGALLLALMIIVSNTLLGY